MHKEQARAKINLNLHVGQVVTDQTHPHFGYHLLTSLVVFADYGDVLTGNIADSTTLSISGPFAKGLETNDTNLVLRAYNAVKDRADIPDLAFSLTKNLPLASGMGGGSADAAAALRILKNYAKLGDDAWQAIALELGADVPVCLLSKTCVMSGIGEKIERIEGMGQLTAILVNPGLQVSTGKIFKRFDAEPIRTDLSQPTGNLLDRFKAGRNDLQSIAIQIAPEIRTCLEVLGPVSQMSGSGATCFGLYTDQAMAQKAAQSIKNKYPDVWVQPVMLGDQL